MSGKVSRPNQNSSASGFTSDVWASIAVTPTGKIVRRSENSSLGDDAASLSKSDRKAGERSVVAEVEVDRAKHDMDSATREQVQIAPSDAHSTASPEPHDERRIVVPATHNRRGGRGINTPKRATMLLQYPFAGELVKCSDRGFGFVHHSLGELMAHIRENARRELHTLRGMDGKYCAFAVGGSPVRYTQQKTDWDRAVVQWILLDDIEEGLTPDAYRTARNAELESLDRGRLITMLTAEWYIQTWQQKSGQKPKALLRSDDLFDHALDEALSRSKNVEDLLRLLGSICTSPYYAIDSVGRQTACKRFFQPSKWNPHVFLPNRPLEECRFYSGLSPLCGSAIKEHMNRARTVAIDLESDGLRIWEFGWKNATGGGRRSDPIDLLDVDLQSAFHESLLSLQCLCIVGHNILGWDIPILQKRRVSFPEQYELWDTLLVAWILTPWERSHALIVEEHGHRADADAARCYDLFEEQAASLAPCLNGSERDVRQLVNSLFDGRANLSAIKGRKYPGNLQKKIGSASLYPRNRIGAIAWQQGYLVQYHTPEERLRDPVMSPEICARVARDSGDIKAKTISVIVKDAAAHTVQVRLSMLPPWLVDDAARTTLREAHIEHDLVVSNDKWLRVYIAEELFTQPVDTCSAWMKDQKLSSAYPFEVLHAWQKAYSRNLNEEEVRAEFPGVSEGRAGRAVLEVHDNVRGAAWLLFEPPGLGESSATWHLLPPVPEEMSLTGISKGGGQDLNAWATMPRWKDGAVSSLDIDRLFVTPDTANRGLYLADIVHCVLNLQKALSEDQILVCAMRWPNEAEALQNRLTLLSLSVLHADSPLRQIERLRKEGLRTIACSHGDLPRYVDAAMALKQSFRIAMDEVPLHIWYTMLHAPEEPTRAPLQFEREVLGEESDEDNDTDEPNEAGTPEAKAVQIMLKSRDIQEGILAFLGDWLGAVLKLDCAPTLPVVIIDSRLSNQSESRTVGLPRENLPFYSLEELLDEKRLEVYHQVCFPRRPDEEIPNSYKSYQAFLQKNWGYPDFLAGTQRPAIEALLGSRRDLLLRLPTGAGKSEIFQVPALLRSDASRRLSVVITPLRALMQDQVHRLWRRYFRESVDYLSGGREAWVNYDVYQGVLDGRIKLLYVAPERFRVPRFTEALERRRRMDGGLEFLVFDEAHCISEWGFGFRPDYLFAARYAAEWFRNKDLPGNPHRLLLTSATVTRRNQQDLERELALRPEEYDDLPKDMPHPIQPFIVLESCDLPESDEPATDDKFRKIVEILAKLNFSRSAALVFVKKREHCHRISEALNAFAVSPGSSLAQVHSLPFHAGLPETVKAEATELLKSRAVNVLVCTKAFGMGMDVPHLHACIHYRPPTFIEDYLQEVGRIGRSKEERDRAGHEQVVGTLLFNHDNLEQNLGLLHDRAVKPPDLQDFFGYCMQHSVPFEQVGKAVCILPAAIRINEFKFFDENQVTNCLFWLERMRILKVEGRHPPFLDLTLKLGSLRILSTTGKASAAVARALLDLVDETIRDVTMQPSPEASGTDRQAVESAFNRFIRGLVRGVLALISPPSSTPERKEPTPARRTRVAPQSSGQDEVAVSVSMSEIMAASGGISVDEFYAFLIELSQAKALSFHKTLVMARLTFPSTDTFLDLLQYAVELLMRPTGGNVEILPRRAFEENLKSWYRDFLLRGTTPEESSSTGEPTNRIAEMANKRRIQREVYRAMGTSLKLARYVGLELKEGLSKDGTTQYARVVPATSIADVQRGVRDRLDAVQKLVTELRNRDPQTGGGKASSFEVGLVDILNALGQETRVSRLRELMNLVEASGFYGLRNSSDEWISVVSLNSLTPLPPHEPDIQDLSASSEKTVPDIRRIQETFAEMLEKHELQVLRAQCMVLFAAMPTENRKQFIDKYFQCLTAKDLQGALEDAVGEVDDEVLAGNQMLQSLLVQVRRERFGKELERLNDAQRAVCAAPFNRKLLVNAGPGSGKTHVLMMRCAHLIHAQNIKPSEILVLAFNRAVVFEIRDRIRDLFRELGYGSHVRGLDVSTFHSFALRHQQASDMYEEDAIGEAVHRFAEAVSGDDSFSRRIAEGYKAILVDEFQDMNEDFYSVVRSLATNCPGGVMVIGDDDQDILTWNRKKWREKHRIPCPLEAVHYFENFRTTFAPEEYALSLNYRSVPEIVSRANGMIAKVSTRLGFTRMKADMNLAAVRTESGAVTLPFNAGTLGDVVREAMGRRTADGKDETVAILCRSNRECRQVCEHLVASEHFASERMDLLGAEDFALYQLRSTGAMMDLCAKRDEWDFVEPYVWEDLLGEYEQLKHADVSRGVEDLKIMYQLIRLERGRPRMRDVVDFVQEMRASDMERLKAKTGLGARAAKVTISTVHKVKGLEYDTVVVMPSSEKFPLNNSTGSDAAISDAAEEARLCYVGMTRARNRLYVAWPPSGRENAWWSHQAFEGAGQKGLYLMKGSPKEIFVSWPGRKGQVEAGLQTYIEKNVCVGDSIALKYGKALYHGSKKVGALADKTAANLAFGVVNQNMRVANVIRYSCGKYFEEKHQDFWAELHPIVKQQRWFYVVLVESI